MDEAESMGLSDHRVIEVTWPKSSLDPEGPTRELWNINKLRENEDMRDKYTGLLRRNTDIKEAVIKLGAKVEEWIRRGDYISEELQWRNAGRYWKEPSMRLSKPL